MVLGTTLRRIAVVLVLMMVVAACAKPASKVTWENYDKLKMGMSFDEVVEILGPPQQEKPFAGIRQCTWVDGDKHIHVKFIFGRALYFSNRNLEPSAAASDAPATGH